MKITVITPTYNRANLLTALYESLKKQTSKNFEWLIIDDGSTDNTESVVKKMEQENKIPIIYKYQDNGGKHRALNFGIKDIKSELTFIVDSDDYLTEDAIETIETYFEKYKDDDRICCISFLKAYEDGAINGPKYKKNEFIGNYITDRLNNHNKGDKAEVFFTEKLKEEPFLEIPGEKFGNEAYVWVKLAIKYDTVFINKVIYIAEYCDDGLTRNMYKVRYKSPIGMIETYKVMYNKKANMYLRTKTMIKYIAYSFIAKRGLSEQFKDTKSKAMYILMLLPGYIFYKKILKNVGA